MSRYIIYSYQFSPITKQDPVLFETTNLSMKDAMENKQEFFKKIFTPSMEFKYKKSRYPHHILYNEDGFIVFKLANRRVQNHEENFQVEKMYNYPSCNIIIDNRKDIQQIAIEEDFDAFTETETVARILENTFNQYLKQYRLVVTVLKKYQETEFWNLVSKCEKGISMVRFHFSYPNLPGVSQMIGEVIQETSRNTNSRQTTFEIKSTPEEELLLSRENPQLDNLAQASADSGNVITIKAKGVKRYIKTGKTSKSIEIDNIEAYFSNDQLFKITETLAERFNSIK